jgi:hypothetical protein
MTQYSGKIIRKNPVVPTQQAASGVWTVTDAAAAVKNNIWPVAGVPDPISRSVRLRSSASAYFNRTPAVASNRRTFTWSGWVKRGDIGATYKRLFDAGSGNDTFMFNPDNTLTLWLNGTAGANVQTTQVFRDVSAWYHLVFAIDTTQATAANRIKLYVNGSQITALAASSYPTQNYDCVYYNTVTQHDIGAYGAGTQSLDGYMTEVNFIDGQALTPSSFGTTDAFTGAWVPMAYTGTYGTNGFYLNFKDNTSTTTLGYDYSGNSNNWTANNISLTAGSTYDSMLDVPTPWVGYTATTDTSAVTRGNYCTLNPLFMNASSISGANSQITGNVRAVGTFGMTSGKWYWECQTTNPSYFMSGGVLKAGAATTEVLGYGDSLSWGWYASSGQKWTGSVNTAWGSAFTSTNDVLGVAFDADTGDLFFYKNGTLQGGGAAFTGLTSGPYFPAISAQPSYFSIINFGQRPFSYTPPTGFKALCTTNLPEPTIKLGAQYMNATLWTGTNSTGPITITGLAFQPDLVWGKSRSNAFSNQLYDSVRGTGKSLISNSTAAEDTTNVSGYISAFNSDGFTATQGSSDNWYWNYLNGTYVGWVWKAAGSSVSNTSGTLTSQVNAGTTQGFSVVTYTGSGSSATVGHGLGVAPSMLIIKRRNTTGNWITYHTSTGINQYLYLNSTAAAATASPTWSVSSSTFGLPQSFSDYNASGGTYVAYCFAEVAGYSAFGSYTGNGSADGPFVYCGFRPRYILVRSTGGADWYTWDSSRNTYNVVADMLRPNLSNAELNSGTYTFDFVSNGFKVRGAGSEINGSGSTFIYMAFAENPFKYSNAR